MSEVELGIVVLCGLFGWIALLHWKINVLGDAQEVQGEHLRRVADQVNRIQKEVRGG